MTREVVEGQDPELLALFLQGESEIVENYENIGMTILKNFFDYYCELRGQVCL